MQHHSVNNSELFIFQDFVSPEQIKKLLEIYSKSSIGGKHGEYDTRNQVVLSRDELHAANYTIADELVYLLNFYKERFRKRFYYVIKNLPLTYSVTNQNQTGLPLHYDILKIDTFIERRLFGNVLYLNDDFEDGEIFFPLQDFSFKPKAGTLLSFPSHLGYPHFVKQHKGSERIIFQGYITYGI
jgi:hypothetical protein